MVAVIGVLQAACGQQPLSIEWFSRAMLMTTPVLLAPAILLHVGLGTRGMVVASGHLQRKQSLPSTDALAYGPGPLNAQVLGVQFPNVQIANPSIRGSTADLEF